VEQLIEVPREHAERARELVTALEGTLDDAQVAQLERQAVEAAPRTAEPSVADPRPLIRVLTVVGALVVLWWLARSFG
jgi:hypothetical protein